MMIGYKLVRGWIYLDLRHCICSRPSIIVNVDAADCFATSGALAMQYSREKVETLEFLYILLAFIAVLIPIGGWFLWRSLRSIYRPRKPSKW